ncbi:NUDIX hydrolase domain-like protein [Zychaea mexicana]|uniref:NUDIX hydrolase domain-like protein n=1 Tax=Zychaea mexicana TaxID=64656 RepID=UPI0022FE2DA8|nr:NUDIX hydrolase domain-like protein [Zychaea mexicana]KAI9497613.1 NUDIX hydrolase domain-like protein [Zychaea mexicana]
MVCRTNQSAPFSTDHPARCLTMLTALKGNARSAPPPLGRVTHASLELILIFFSFLLQIITMLTPLTAVEQDNSTTERLGEGAWLALERVRYKDSKQIERTWERVIRKNKVHRQDARSALDAVDIHAVIVTPEPELLLVVQYRPAIQRYCIEFPSGLIDQDEDPIDAAAREFHEETGYQVDKSAIRLHKSAAVSYEPGLTNSCCCVAQITIHDHEKQQDVIKQQLEPDEWSLQTVRLPLRNLMVHLLELERAHDGQLIIDSRVHAYAAGLMAHDQFLGTSTTNTLNQ